MSTDDQKLSEGKIDEFVRNLVDALTDMPGELWHPIFCEHVATIYDAAYRAGREDAARSAPDLDHYSAALDEIYRLRCALVYEARILETHMLMATFPKSRRGIGKDQIRRMRAAARGETCDAYAELSSGTAKGLLMAAGAPETLTRGAWEIARGQQPREDVTP